MICERPMRARRLRTERGMSTFGFFFMLAIVGIFVYIGYRVLPFYYSYYEILGLMENQAAKSQVLTDIEMRKTILEKIKKLNIPFSTEDTLRIVRTGGRTKIDFKYKEVLDVDFGNGRYYKLWVFEFHPQADRAAGR